MEPTLAAVMTALAVLTLVSVVTHWRAKEAATRVRHREMAAERGLGAGEIKQLEHLARLVDDTSLADLLISPVRYNRAVTAYVKRLRAGSVSEARYFGTILELTRLRRKVHPPGNLLRFLHSTRELPEGEEISASPVGGRARTLTIWGVNEDHIELRGDIADLEPGAPLLLELFRAGQGLYRMETQLRSAEPREDTAARGGSIRLEHSDQVRVENRREHLRERARATLFVTPVDGAEPTQATLHEISGGGLAFLTEQPLTTDAGVAVTLALGRSEAAPIKALAYVLRAAQTPSGQWRHVARWERIDESEREAIVRYVFSLQRRRIRGERDLPRVDETA